MNNTCVMCGDDIPEGRQVCYICERKVSTDLNHNTRRHTSLWQQLIKVFKQKTV